MIRLRELRKKKGLTGPQMAEMLHISTQFLYDMEKGKRRIHAEMLSEIADILGVSTDYLLGRAEQVSESKDDTDYAVGFWGKDDDINIKALKRIIDREVEAILAERQKDGKTS